MEMGLRSVPFLEVRRREPQNPWQGKHPAARKQYTLI